MQRLQTFLFSVRNLITLPDSEVPACGQLGKSGHAYLIATSVEGSKACLVIGLVGYPIGSAAPAPYSRCPSARQASKWRFAPSSHALIEASQGALAPSVVPRPVRIPGFQPCVCDHNLLRLWAQTHWSVCCLVGRVHADRCSASDNTRTIPGEVRSLPRRTNGLPSINSRRLRQHGCSMRYSNVPD